MVKLEIVRLNELQLPGGPSRPCAGLAQMQMPCVQGLLLGVPLYSTKSSTCKVSDAPVGTHAGHTQTWNPLASFFF